MKKGIVKFTQEQKDKRRMLINAINETSYSPKDLGISRQQLVAWSDLGIIRPKDEKGGWRRFNLVESIWTLLLIELRGFGYPLAAMKNLHEQIMSGQAVAEQYLKFISNPFQYIKDLPDVSISNGTKYIYQNNEFSEAELIEQLSKEFDARVMRFPELSTHLFTYIEHSLLHKENLLLAINQKGMCVDSINHVQYKGSKQIYSSGNRFNQFIGESAIVVSVTKLVYRLMGIKPAIKKQHGLSQFFLDEKEEKLMNLLRSSSKALKEVKVTLQDGQMKFLHTTSDPDPELMGKVAELLADKKYMSIEANVKDDKPFVLKSKSIKL